MISLPFFQFFYSGQFLIKLLTNFDNLSLQFHNSNSNIQVFAINLQFVWYHSFLLFFFPLGRDLITIPSPLQFLRVITTVVNLVSRHDLKSHRILLGTGSNRHFFFVNVFKKLGIKVKVKHCTFFICVQIRAWVGTKKLFAILAKRT